MDSTVTTHPTHGRGSLREALAKRVVVADGAMGTMLQAADPSLDDFQGHEGCNEILNVTRPELVASVHDAYFSVGVDCVETNTFGANYANLGEYGIEDRIFELAAAGAAIARRTADEWSTPGRPRWVLGSVGPGTKLPSLGHAPFALLRDAYEQQVAGLVAGGADAILIETAQDLLQAKAAIIGARRALRASGVDLPVFAQVTVETTGTMLLGTEIGAALTALAPLGIDMIGLNCATGPSEMSEHLRTLARSSTIGISSMPNAGLPVLTSDGAHYPLSPVELADAHDTFTRDFGLTLVGGCCGTTPEHLKHVVDRVRGREITPRKARHESSAASLYQSVPFRQDTAYLSIGERTNANGSRAFRDAMLEQRWDDCIEIARDQIRDGAHLLDLCIDYVGRDGVADMRELAGRLATASTLPIVLDSTEPAVLKAGLEMLGGRAVINSVNYEDGDGPDSRFGRIMPLVAEHGAAVVALTIDEEGQARTADWKVSVADRLIRDLTGKWGMSVGDILVDTLTFPIATGQEETRRDGIETIEAIRRLKTLHPGVQTTLGLSNVSFGLNPAARQVLNSVFLHECIAAGLDSAIVHASKILPMSKIADEQRHVALDLVYDRRTYDADGNTLYDPLQRFLELFEGVEARNLSASRAEELAGLPLFERLERRIIDGERIGLEADLDEALTERPALEIVNDTLLAGMKVVGELFASGEMQLPFVLQSAEVMKTAVAHLEPHMEKTDEAGKGTMVLATVKGDVHDIGKNLVDIILSNNGYTVVNIGIKQPISAIIDAAESNDADVIGMSGLLVKSTVIMKENLEELNARKVAERFPVVLGGAALTRSYVEQDLADIYEGEVRYARDAFEGLRLMDAVMAVKRGVPGAALPERRARRVTTAARPATTEPIDMPARSDVAVDVQLPTPPFWGDRIVKGVALADYVPYLDERALFLGQWGLKPTRGDGPSYEELVETEGRPRLRHWLDRIQTEAMIEPAVAYGYFPCHADGDDLVVLNGDGEERTRFSFPRQRRDRHLCLSDFFRPKESGDTDVVAFTVVTMGEAASRATAQLFEADAYRDYLELHGLSVQLTEALAEYWHARIRDELGLAAFDSTDMDYLIAKQGYRGSRYSFGYPACPDLEQQVQLMELLVPERIGVVLSEEFQLHPEQSTSAIIAHHPEAKYFNAT
ncbi:MAG: 5-methyltetrahydrofolate--homocysteine methyltransferase [Actinomycetota bacterium]|nr:5-methyltetrahydrofolate--homocysteine methyltransferase [Actinomycetota bacterium]